MIRLEPKYVTKPWGRQDVTGFFNGAPAGVEPIGEVWFEAPFPVPLLVKFLFTSAPLSIQVHPADAPARAMGLPQGKDEAWFILDADSGAVIGLGLQREVSRAELRRAAGDGSIEQLVDWRPVVGGEAIYSPGGTVHALGAGLKLVEFQQNLDLTFRLYDFGRSRQLQVEQAADVAICEPYKQSALERPLAPGRTLIADGPAFRVERWSGPVTIQVDEAWQKPVWVVPLAGGVRAGEQTLRFSEVWLLEDSADICLNESGSALVAYTVRPD